jgi:DNA-binding transcriptional MerR regulator
MDHHLLIGDLAALTGASPRTLRYYEEQGLLQPARSGAGYRLYSEQDIETVRRIQLLLSAGLPTQRMIGMLHCLEGEAPFVTVGCGELVAVLDEHGRRIDADIAALRRSRAVVDRLRGHDREREPAASGRASAARHDRRSAVC